MGNLHPISLKLKKKQLWKSRIYQFKSTNLIESQNKQKISENLLNHTLGKSWQNHLISKPIFKESSSEVKILIYWWAPGGGSQGGKFSASRGASRRSGTRGGSFGGRGLAPSAGGVQGRKGRSGGGGFANGGGGPQRANWGGVPMGGRNGVGGGHSAIAKSMVGGPLQGMQMGSNLRRIEALCSPSPKLGQGVIVAGSAGMVPIRVLPSARLVHQSAFAAMAHPVRQGGQAMLGAKSNLFGPGRRGANLGHRSRSKAAVRGFAAPRPQALYDSVRKLADNQMKLIFGKKVNIKLIRLRSPLLNSYLLAQFIRIQSSKRSLAFIWRKIKRKVKFAAAGAASHSPSAASLARSNSSVGGNGRGADQFGTGNSAPFDWNNLVREGSTLAKGVNSYISGLKLQMSGRFTRRKGASRTTTQTYQIGGNFNFNSSSSLIDYAIIKTKAKNGSIGIKVYVSSRLQA